jgi:hypothetical protein
MRGSIVWKDQQEEAGHLLPRRHNKEYDALDRGESVREHHVRFGSEVLIHNDIRERKPKSGIDPSASQFGARISFLLFIASLFIVVRPNGKGWPQGSWVVITTLMVSWFPSMDAASIIEKSIQRCMGTLSGGFLGLFLGFLCYKIPNMRTRVICLELCFVLGVFFICFWSVQYKLSRTTKLISLYSYASSLCLLTYSIAIFPFYQADNPWEKAAFRVLNVAIGSAIGTVGSVIVLPRSTSALLLQRIQDQCKLAGESAEAVLHAAADVFSGDMALLKFSELLQETKVHVRVEQRKLRGSLLRKSFRRVNQAIIDEGSDVALEKYESAIKEWRVTKGLFSLLRYDPFNYFMECKDDFKNGCAVTLEDALYECKQRSY